MLSIIFIIFYMLNHLCTSGINLIWDWCMIFILCCFVDFKCVFILRLCLYVCMSVCRNVHVRYVPIEVRGIGYLWIWSSRWLWANWCAYWEMILSPLPNHLFCSINTLLNLVIKLFIEDFHLCSSMKFIYSSLFVLCSYLILEWG